MRRHSILVIAIALLASACGGASEPTPRTAGSANPAPTAGASVGPISSAVPSAGGPVGPAQSPAGSASALVLRATGVTGADVLQVVDGSTGARATQLPVGVADPAWSTVYSASNASGTTVVRALDVRTGTDLRKTELAGAWTLPEVIPGDLPGGLARHGGTLVLVDAAPGAGASRFALIDTAFRSAPAVITLTGRFEFDAIGANGRYLFLLERLDDADGHYQVRAYDTQAGALVEAPIVDKREIGEEMEGRPIARSESPDGAWTDTVYVRDDGTAFIHQLNTADAYAFCVDLPSDIRAVTPADSADWKVLATGGGGFVTNGRMRFIGAFGDGNVTASERTGRAGMRLLAPRGTAGAWLLEPTLLSALESDLRGAGRGPAIEGRGMVAAAGALYVLTRAASVQRIDVAGAQARADRTVTLDPAVDWEDAALVGATGP